MNKLLKTIKQLVNINIKSELLMELSTTLIAGILGVFLVFLIHYSSDENTYFELGTAMALIFGLIIVIFAGIFSFTQDFNLAVGMGKPRKHFIPAYYLTHVAYLLVGYLAVLLFYQVEKSIYPMIWPGAVHEMNVLNILYNPKAVIATILGIPMFALLLSALVMRFSQKAFWVLWALWMLGCIGIPRLIKVDSSSSAGSSISEILTGMVKVMKTGAGWIIIAGVIAVIGVVNYMLLKKQRVTQ